jgi:HlyD family secretion protein
MVELERMNRRMVLIIAAAVLLFAVGFFVLRSDRGGVPVDIAAVSQRPVFRSFVTSSGQIVATRYADIGASAMGRLVKLAVKEGDRVRAGQLLAQIDAVQASASAAGARARVLAAESDERGAEEQSQASQADVAAAAARAQEAMQTLARTRDLRGQGIVADADLDRAKSDSDAATAQLHSAQAALRRVQQGKESASRRLSESRSELARINDVLSKTDIVSPIDGIVTRLPVQEGEMVVIGIQNQPGTTLMTVSDLSAIDAEVKVAEADVLRVRIGQPASVTLEALPAVAFPGHVVEIGASALPVAGAAAAREFKVKVRLDKADPSLRPGLTCDTEILTAERQNALTVPLQSVVIRPGRDEGEQTGVFVLEDRVVRFRAIQAGLIGGLEMEITGLPKGTPIVAGPFQALRELQDGQKVRVQAKIS